MSNFRKALSPIDWPELGQNTPAKDLARHQAYLRRRQEEKKLNDRTPKQIAFDKARSERRYYLDDLNGIYVQ